MGTLGSEKGLLSAVGIWEGFLEAEERLSQVGECWGAVTGVKVGSTPSEAVKVCSVARREAVP